jgi:hypothetical protein
MSARANTTSHSEWSAAPDKSFVATKAFNVEFYQYTVSRAANLSMQGELVLHAQATANRCPAGRVLHANGKKLIPGVNPMTVFTTPAGATIQAPKFMLGVYDPQSMLNGFIDPTSNTFAVYDKNRPASAYLAEATGNLAEATAVAAMGGQGAALLTANNAAGLTVADNTVVAQTVAAGSARSGSIVIPAAGGSVVFPTSVTVSSTEVTANSLVLLSVVDGVAAAGTFAVLTAAPSAGSFVFTTNATAKTVQFVVIN